jgi:hypothetical protein
MAETQVVPEPKAEPKAAPIELPFSRRGKQRLNLAWRAVKMAVPQCEICQETGKAQWWKDCPHSPYVQNVRTDIEVPQIKCMKCGKQVPEGTFSHCGTQDFEQTGTKLKPKFTPQLNTREVRIDESADSGRSLEKSRAKGWSLPSNFGFAPMCEFSRCYEPNPQIRTAWGLYCCEEEAKLVALMGDAEAVEVFDQRRRNQQLRSISL